MKTNKQNSGNESPVLTAGKHTKGQWRISNDAQGPCMIMHPTLEGVAIANLSDCFKPANGMHDPTTKKPVKCPEISGVTYHPERVANARLIASAPALLAALEKLTALCEDDYDIAEVGGTPLEIILQQSKQALAQARPV